MPFGPTTYENPYLAMLERRGGVTFSGGVIITSGGVSESPSAFVDAANFADLPSAVAAAYPGQCVLLHPGASYTLTSTLVLPVGVSLFSPSSYRGMYGAVGGALIRGAVSPLIQFDTGNVFAGKQMVSGISFDSSASGTNAYCTLYNFNGYSISNLQFYNCNFNMSNSSATNRAAIWHTWAQGGTVEQCYFEQCNFNACDTAIGGSDTTYAGDFDKCVIEKCRFDECRGTSAMPAIVYFNFGYMRGGAIRDCVFQGATNNCRNGVYLGAQFQCYEIDNCFFGGVASQAANTYDEIVVADPPGSVTPGGSLLVSGCRLNDHEASTNYPRYSLNLENLGGAFRNMGNPTFTNGSPNITLASHGLKVDDIVLLTTTGTLPTGFVNGGTYVVIAAGLSTNVFNLSATVGGTAITAGSAGSGTHTAYHIAPSAFVVASNMGTIRYSRYGSYSVNPPGSVEIHATTCSVS